MRISERERERACEKERDRKRERERSSMASFPLVLSLFVPWIERRLSYGNHLFWDGLCVISSRVLHTQHTRVCHLSSSLFYGVHGISKTDFDKKNNHSGYLAYLGFVGRLLRYRHGIRTQGHIDTEESGHICINVYMLFSAILTRYTDGQRMATEIEIDRERERHTHTHTYTHTDTQTDRQTDKHSKRRNCHKGGQETQDPLFYRAF